MDAELQESRIEVQGLRVALSHLQKESNTLIHEKVDVCEGVFVLVIVTNNISLHSRFLSLYPLDHVTAAVFRVAQSGDQSAHSARHKSDCTEGFRAAVAVTAGTVLI